MNEKDTHVVFVSPKAFGDSSGTTWANETMVLCTMHPTESEVAKQSSENNSMLADNSLGLRSYCAIVHDCVRY